MTDPHYSTLSKEDVSKIETLVIAHGFGPVILALGDILTQRYGADTELSLLIGWASEVARHLDTTHRAAGAH